MSPSPPYLTALLTSSLRSSSASLRRSGGSPCSKSISVARAALGEVCTRGSWVVSRLFIRTWLGRYPERLIRTPPQTRKPARCLAGFLSLGVPHSALEALEDWLEWCPAGAGPSPPPRWDFEGRR